MKLYYSPGACSLAPHIVLLETGQPFTLVRASTRTHKLDDGTDFHTINPLGYVPVLELDNGERLTEGPAILQYLADRAPQSGLAPANGTWERYRLQEWLNFITSELHKSYSPLFRSNTPEDYKPIARELLLKRHAHVDARLAGRPYLLGEFCTVADIYLFVVTTWAQYVAVDLSGFPHLQAFMTSMMARQAVQTAMRSEGLLKA